MLIFFFFPENYISKTCRDILRKDCCKLKAKENVLKQNCYCAKSVNSKNVEKCTDSKTYDYFNNSRISYIATFTGLIGIFCGTL